MCLTDKVVVSISDVAGDVKALSVYYEEKDKFTKVVVASSVDTDKDAPANKLLYFDLPPDIHVGKSTNHHFCDLGNLNWAELL